MPSLTQDNRPLAVTTPLGKDVLLLEKITGSEAISGLYSFRLEMLSTKTDSLAFGDLLGQKVTVEIRTNEGKNKRYFNGIINRLSQGSKATGQEKQSFVRYQAEIVPQLWLLGRNRNSRIFQTISIPDILKEILQKQWSLDVAFQLQGDFKPRDYCVQYEESDLNFVSRLMEEEGIFYFFIHKEDGHQMVLANSPRSHPDLAGIDSVPFEEEGSGAPDPNRVTNWIKSQEIRSPKVTLWDYCFELPASHLDAQETVLGKQVDVGTAKHPFQVGGNQRLELYDFPGGYAQRFDGVQPGGGDRNADIQNIFTDNRRTCQIRMEQETVQGLAIEGAGRCWQFTSGSKFNFKGHFDADGAYVLTRITHTANMEGAYLSGADAEMTYRNTFTCIPLALPYRPQRVTPKPQIVGPQTAVVVGPKGEEIFCDKYGRVKVQFHWDRLGKTDANSSCWVRVAQVWAGKGWGAFFWPRIGHEVVVSFEEGDPDRPLIIGNVYNATNMPPFPLPKENLLSGFKSSTVRGQASENFNGIVMFDEKGKEHVSIHSERHLVFNSEFDKVQRAGRHKAERVSSGALLTVGNLPGGGGSGGGPDPYKPFPNPAPQGVGGLNSVMVYGENLQVAVGLNHQLAVGSNLQICVNPAGLADMIPGMPIAAPVAAMMGSGLGGNMQLTIGTSANVLLGRAFNINLGPEAIEVKTEQQHAASYAILGVLGGLAIIWVIAYAGNNDEHSRVAQVIAFQILFDLALLTLMLIEMEYKSADTGMSATLQDLFKTWKSSSTPKPKWYEMLAAFASVSAVLAAIFGPIAAIGNEASSSGDSGFAN
jgi:type VI secretion system secreted protein VgrG